MANDNCIVTLDGPAGSGKTTVARRVAERLGYRFLDTGAMYRAAALAALEAGVALDPLDAEAVTAAVTASGLGLDDLGNVRLRGRDVAREIRTERISAAASPVATVPGVRAFLTRMQREFGRRAEPGLVAEGRDMATVVFRTAAHRFYLSASVEIRAARRREELLANTGDAPSLATMIESIEVRDERDASRDHAPLRVGPGVVVIPTDDLEIDDVVDRVVARIDVVCTRGAAP